MRTEGCYRLLILQGGGALGAYECGVYQALEERGIAFDAVAGVSIGAINGAIIAGNPAGERGKALRGFWREAGLPFLLPPGDALRRHFSAACAAVFGNPQLFVPRWLDPWLAMSMGCWTSLYDARPMKRLVEKYVSFDYLAKKEVRLFLAAVNIETGRMELFDSFREPLTADHVMASGALPPGLPPVTVNGKTYWDGGLVSNTPLPEVLDRLVTLRELQGQADTLRREVYIVDLFPREGDLPRDLGEVIGRHKDILYAARIDSDIHQFQVMDQALSVINELLSQVPEDVARRVRRSPPFLHVLSHTWGGDLVRISHRPTDRDEFHFKDYDFSPATIAQRIEAGYRDALAALEPRMGPQGQADGGDAGGGKDAGHRPGRGGGSWRLAGQRAPR